jgi:D-xylose transport system ATP-binding protein
VSALRAASYLGALLVIFVALISPLDALSEELSSLHMVQHMLLIIVAAPLLVIGSPALVLAWGLPEIWNRKQVLRLVRRLADRGLAVILISHNMNDVLAVADDIAVLYLGRMTAQVQAKDVTHTEVVGLITGGGAGGPAAPGRPSAPGPGNDETGAQS